MTQPVTSDTVFVLFSVKATPPGPAGPMASEMLLIYLQDAGGKVLALAWHAGSGQWGIQSNGNYLNNFLPSYVADWTQVELILDQKRRKATEILTNGAKQTVLYNAVNFTDQDAGQLASIQLVRNKDGNDQKIAIDDFSVVVPASQP